AQQVDVAAAKRAFLSGIVAGNREVAAIAQLADETETIRMAIHRVGIYGVALVVVTPVGFVRDDVVIAVASVGVREPAGEPRARKHAVERQLDAAGESFQAILILRA